MKDSRIKILATITTYNPDMDLLRKNVESIKPQVDKLIVYENASDNRGEIAILCSENDTELILNDTNQGVAGPLYNGIDYAKSNGYSYILTLDQDSVSSEKMVETLLNKLLEDNSLAVAAALPSADNNINSGIQDYYTLSVITSGSLFDVDKIYSIGNYIPEMFMDWVDTEICYRIRENGYRILQCCVPINHRLGNLVEKKFLWKRVYTPDYTLMRYYYIWRNANYCFIRYKNDKDLTKFCKKCLFKYKMKVIFFESKKFKKISAMRKGKKASKKFFSEISEKYADTKVVNGGDVTNER